MYTDPGNLQELCRHHHDMTTASMDRKRLEKEKGPLPKTRKKKPKKTVVDPAARKKAAQQRKRQKESWAALTRRGAFKRIGHGGKALQNRIDKSMKLKGTKVESLYPPDHWLHDPKKYDESKCKMFEGEGWRWDKKGGASDSQSRPSPHYRPPPSKKSKLL